MEELFTDYPHFIVSLDNNRECCMGEAMECCDVSMFTASQQPVFSTSLLAASDTNLISLILDTSSFTLKDVQ